MDLITELAAFDGKHTAPLETLATRLSPTAILIQELCTLARQGDAKLQTATTWLLKRFQETGVVFASEQVQTCLALLHHVTDWEARLHLLQMLPGFAIPLTHKNALYHHLKTLLTDNKKFVRAWAYNGLVELAEQYPDLQVKVSELLARGQQEESASVRARIRNRIKTLQWR